LDIPFYKKLLSYFYPVLLRHSSGAVNASLKIYLYRNQFQLTTPDAFYSDGDRYRPAIEVVRNLKLFLPDVKNMLVLGTGLGSIVRVMKANGFNPNYTLVELDEVVLKWAIELLDEDIIKNIKPVNADAKVFMARNTDKFDLIFIDIFNSRVVPEFVTTPVFLTQCLNSLNPGGHLAFNYIVNDQNRWEGVRQTFTSVFPENKIIKEDINRIFIV